MGIPCRNARLAHKYASNQAKIVILAVFPVLLHNCAGSNIEIPVGGLKSNNLAQ